MGTYWYNIIMWLRIIIHAVIRIATYTLVVYGVALISI